MLSQNRRHKQQKKERSKDSAKKHIKRLSLVAFGIDEKLAETALKKNDYDINAAVEFIEQNKNANKMIQDANTTNENNDDEKDED